MKNKTTPETLILAQAKEKANELFAQAMLKARRRALRNKKIGIAQIVANTAHLFVEQVNAGKFDGAEHLLDEMRAQVNLIRAQPILSPKNSESGGFKSPNPKL